MRIIKIVDEHTRVSCKFHPGKILEANFRIDLNIIEVSPCDICVQHGLETLKKNEESTQ